jgi:hypothetical protein
MADPTPVTPTNPPTPEPKKPARTRGLVNQNLLDELSGADEIVAVTRKDGYAVKLAAGGIDATKITALTAAIASARTLAAQATQGTTGRQGVTQTEAELFDNLVDKIKEVQKRARQKYDATEPLKLKDYAVAQRFDNSRSLLEQTAANVLEKLKTDTLPGITPEKIAALQAALAEYQGVQGDQTGAQSGATTARKELEAAVDGIIAKRREIQFAADAEWPHTNPAHAGIRAEFKLPPDRVMK